MSDLKRPLCTLRSLKTVLLLIANFALGTVPLRGQPIELCDRLAAAPKDLSKVGPGVPFEEMDVVAAIGACEDAVRDYPLVVRFRFQLGRALSKAGREHDAASQYEAAVASGYVPAAHNLGILYLQRNSVISNPERGLSLVRLAAEAGFSLSQYQLGQFYAQGQYVERDLIAAAEWFRKAAEQGEPSAQNDLGYMYKSGTGVTQDIVQAIELFRRSAAQGNLLAEYNLGVVYQNGVGVEPNLFEAAKWYAAAASQGHMWAQNDLAVLYQNGRGVERDPNKAIELFRASASRGHVLAEINLGKTYEFGLGVPVDWIEAVRWYTAASDHGNTWAQNELGLMYQNGKGVQQNYAKAIKLYRKAADQGDALGQANVGFMYAHGYGVAQSYSEAVIWYQLAASHGNAWAQNELGLMYLNGKGVERDFTKALEFFKRSAAGGNAAGQANEGVMYANGYGVEKDYGEASKRFRLAAKVGNGFAMAQLAWLSWRGIGVPSDGITAYVWYRLAIEAGYSEATLYLGQLVSAGVYLSVEIHNGLQVGFKQALNFLYAKPRVRLLFKWPTFVDAELRRDMIVGRLERRSRVENAISPQNRYAIAYAIAQDEVLSMRPEFAIRTLTWTKDLALTEAASWLQKAIEAGSKEALLSLANLYLGEDPTDSWHNFAEARYAREGATSGNVGLPASVPFVGSAARAAELYEQAVHQGSTAARINLAILYELGHGRQKDIERALRLYREALGTRFDGQAQFGLLRNSFAKIWEAETQKWGQFVKEDEQASTASTEQEIIIKSKKSFLRIVVSDQIGRRVFAGTLTPGQQYRVQTEQNNLILWLDYSSSEDVEIQFASTIVDLPNDKGTYGVRLDRTLFARGTGYLIRGTYEKVYSERIPDEMLEGSRLAIEVRDKSRIYIHDEHHLIGFPADEANSLNSGSRLRVPKVDGLMLELRPFEASSEEESTSRAVIELDGHRVVELAAPPGCLVTLGLNIEDLKAPRKIQEAPENCASFAEDDPPKPFILSADDEVIGYVRKLPNEKVAGVIAGRLNRGITLLNLRISQRWDEAYRAVRIFYEQDLRDFGPNSFDTIKSALTLCELEIQLGMAASARTRLDAILETLNQIGSVPFEISVKFFDDFGAALATLGRYAEAERSFIHAIALQEHRNQTKGLTRWNQLGRLLGQLSSVAEKLGRLDDAISYGLQEELIGKSALPERSDELNAEIAPPIGLLDLLRRVGLNDQFLSLLPYLHREAKREIVRDLPEPLKFPLKLSWAEATFGNVDHSGIIANSLGNLGQIYSWMGRHAEALPLAEQLAKTRGNIYGESNPQTSIALAKVADEYRLMGVTQDAIAIARKALEAAKSFVAARRSSQQAASAGVSALKPAALALLEALYAQRNLDDFTRSALDEEAFEVAQHVHGSSAALALQAFGDRLQQSDGRTRDYVRRRQDLSEELGRLDAMLVSAVSSGSAFGDPRRQNELKRKIAKTESEIRSMQMERPVSLKQFDELTEANIVSYARTKLLLDDDEAVVTFVSGDEATFVFLVSRQQLKWRRVAIGTYALDNMVATLRCGLDQQQWETTLSDKTRSDCLRRTGIIEDPEPKFLLPFRLDVANELYQALFGPFEDDIREKHLIVISDGTVAALPLQVLVTNKPEMPIVERLNDYKTISWLGVRQPISLLPSVSSLNSLRKIVNTNTAPDPFIGFANPLLVGPNGDDRRAFQANSNSCGATPAKQVQTASLLSSAEHIMTRGGTTDVEELRKLPPLPETTRELCAVASSLGAPESALHVGDKATETAVKDMNASGLLARPRIIEFATHALLPGNNTSIESGLTEPALVLTPPPVGRNQSELEFDDGLLTASEIAQLKLNADWVVLSACNTAGGEKTGGEALSGLARAFFFAGTRALLVSHWKVASEAAVKLTTRAFAEMHEHPRISRSEALRRSMSALIATGGFNAHPTTWAPFVLVGD